MKISQLQKFDLDSNIQSLRDEIQDWSFKMRREIEGSNKQIRKNEYFFIFRHVDYLQNILRKFLFLLNGVDRSLKGRFSRGLVSMLRFISRLSNK
jgi:hypothetical protein